MEEIREWEIGWALHSDYCKKGYATEVVGLLIQSAFNNLNAHRKVAYSNAENSLSEKVMIRAGMVRDWYSYGR
ncbi:GNAT family N-acetyltransferase [Paenibacillus sp. OAS669]|uniref:GNAT family N-acetyltransferase n=1 Tax=Paenibacillus sp. OAS669 TaxID=2663821 RepID=UPI00178BD99F